MRGDLTPQHIFVHKNEPKIVLGKSAQCHNIGGKILVNYYPPEDFEALELIKQNCDTVNYFIVKLFKKMLQQHENCFQFCGALDVLSFERLGLYCWSKNNYENNIRVKNNLKEDEKVKDIPYGEFGTRSNYFKLRP